MNNRIFNVICFLFIATGCAGGQVSLVKLAGYSEAKKIGKTTKKSIVLFERSIDVDSLPMLIPYMEANCFGGRRTSEKVRADLILKESIKEEPDYVIFANTQSYATGSTGVYWGFGISTSQTNYAHKTTARLLRILPSNLGFTFNTENIVTSRQSKSVLDSGLLEGDKILSIDNRPITLKNVRLKLLKSRPGQKVDLVWIRPGKGRMTGEIELVENKAD